MLVIITTRFVNYFPRETIQKYSERNKNIVKIYIVKKRGDYYFTLENICLTQESIVFFFNNGKIDEQKTIAKWQK